jgi:hypothetical protein
VILPVTVTGSYRVILFLIQEAGDQDLQLISLWKLARPLS